MAGMTDAGRGELSLTAPAPVAPPGARHRRSAGRITRRQWVITVAVVVGLVALTGGWVGLRGLRAKDHLVAAATLMRQLQSQIAAADLPAAEATLTSLQAQTRAARLDTTDPVWRAAAHLPAAGGNLTAIATIAEVLDDLAQHVLPPLIRIAGSVDPAALAPRDGQVDIADLDRLAPVIRAADAGMSAARDRVAAIGTAGLVGPVAGGVADLRRELDHAASVTATAALAAALLPPMLGLRSARTYMVLFQNLAEPRATGGEMGAYAVVRADHGRIAIVDQGTAAGDLQTFPAPVLALDPAMSSLYTDRLGKFPADVNATPHFPTAAALARQMYQLRTGRTVDGVVATDPVALSYLLSATGPVSVGGGTRLTADNAVAVLLSEVYSRITTPVDQDRYFADAARAAFDTLTQGHGDPRAALAGLVRAASERRILVWSADPAEQARLAGTVLGGSLPDHDGDRPTVGIFLNDGTGAKLGYYLTRASRVSVGGCRSDGRRELRVEVSLASTAPSSGLPTYVSGTGELVAPYTLRTNLMVFSPTGGAILSASRDATPTPVGSGAERGRAVAVSTVELRPGESTTVTVGVLTGPMGASGFTPIVWTTPGVNSWPVAVESAAPCPGVR